MALTQPCFTNLTPDQQNFNIYESLKGIAGFDIPTYDFIDLNYVGSTNNLLTVVYKTGGSGGTIVATLSFTYVGGTPSTDDALIDTITQS
jgi:hypothetical protein